VTEVVGHPSDRTLCRGVPGRVASLIVALLAVDVRRQGVGGSAQGGVPVLRLRVAALRAGPTVAGVGELAERSSEPAAQGVVQRPCGGVVVAAASTLAGVSDRTQSAMERTIGNPSERGPDGTPGRAAVLVQQVRLGDDGLERDRVARVPRQPDAAALRLEQRGHGGVREVVRGEPGRQVAQAAGVVHTPIVSRRSDTAGWESLTLTWCRCVHAGQRGSRMCGGQSDQLTPAAHQSRFRVDAAQDALPVALAVLGSASSVRAGQRRCKPS
jgi:hypothetical protein